MGNLMKISGGISSKKEASSPLCYTTHSIEDTIKGEEGE